MLTVAGVGEGVHMYWYLAGTVIASEVAVAWQHSQLCL